MLGMTRGALWPGKLNARKAPKMHRSRTLGEHGGVKSSRVIAYRDSEVEDGCNNAVDEREQEQHKCEAARQEGAVGQHRDGQDEADRHGQRKVHVLHDLASAWQRQPTLQTTGSARLVACHQLDLVTCQRESQTARSFALLVQATCF